MAYTFETLHQLYNEYLKPIMDFSGLYIHRKTGHICVMGTEVPIVFDEKVAIVPLTDGMYKRIQNSMDRYEIFNPFIKLKHMLYLTYALVARLNSFYIDFNDDIDDEVRGPEFWNDPQNEKINLQLEYFLDRKNNIHIYQIIHTTDDVAIAEGQFNDQTYALFALCVDALSTKGAEAQIKWAKELIKETIPVHAIKIEKKIASFNKKLQTLKTLNYNEVLLMDEQLEDNFQSNFCDQYIEFDPLNMKAAELVFFDPSELGLMSEIRNDLLSSLNNVSGSSIHQAEYVELNIPGVDVPVYVERGLEDLFGIR